MMGSQQGSGERVRRDLDTLKDAISDERLSRMVAEWTAASVCADAIEPVLRYFECFPEVDVGMPGPLVHFVEQFRGRGYEQHLLESLERRPVGHTVWMLNRLIHGTPSGAVRDRYVRAMSKARDHPRIDEQALAQAEHFLRRLG